MKNFKRVMENFVCEHCGSTVFGNGYTDHCPECLWGKHMDSEIPGDRASECKGLMKPMRVLYTKGKMRIEYRCVECGHIFLVDSAESDNREKLLELVT